MPARSNTSGAFALLLSINVKFMSTLQKKKPFIFISGFPRDADEICPLLSRYAASRCNPLPTFWENVSAPPSRVKKSLEDGTYILSRNVGKNCYAALCSIPEERKSQHFISHYRISTYLARD
jgi:hypothetical protein